MAKHSKGSGKKRAWGKGLYQSYEDMPKSNDGGAPESIFRFIDKIEKIQRKVDGKPENKVTIVRNDVLLDLFDRAASYQFINQGERLKTLFKNVENGMTNGQLSGELKHLKEQAENKKQKISSEIVSPKP